MKLLAVAQLLRLPNVFTAFADVCLAACAAGYAASQPGVFALTLAATGCLYLGGMVWNDVFDRKTDAKTQAFRPIPAGRVTVGFAVRLGVLLFAAGISFAYAAGGAACLPLVGGLVVAILAYNSWLKHTVVGPVAMGLCRFLNVLFALAVAGEVPAELGFHLAGTIGVYIVGVTWFARSEEADSRRRNLTLAAGVMLVALAPAVTVPAHLPAGSAPFYFPYLVVGFGLVVGPRVLAAVRRPGPKDVQAAVKRCILGLIVLDAVLATAFVGGWGFLILLLLPPALRVGKWVYLT